jgi:hypothetical protein
MASSESSSSLMGCAGCFVPLIDAKTDGNDPVSNITALQSGISNHCCGRSDSLA